jgi:diketogulonate reductase-like aldo/keto reductase
VTRGADPMREPPVLRSLDDRVQIAPGVAMARLGLGTYKSEEGPDVEGEVSYGLEIGYRHIDTAALYGNERGVGRALRASGLAREAYTVATKVWNSDQGYESTLRAFDASMERLGLDYVDIYLIHWPMPKRMRETWRAMEEIHESGRAKAIGVCNFLVHHLEDLRVFANVPPALDQVEHHVRLQRTSATTATSTASPCRRGRRSCAGASRRSPRSSRSARGTERRPRRSRSAGSSSTG